MTRTYTTDNNRRERILAYIKAYLSEKQYAPSIRGMADVFQVSTSVINYHLNELVREKRIERDARVARGIRVLSENLPKPTTQ